MNVFDVLPLANILNYLGSMRYNTADGAITYQMVQIADVELWIQIRFYL